MLWTPLNVLDDVNDLREGEGWGPECSWAPEKVPVRDGIL
jgi:hypothetical protein